MKSEAPAPVRRAPQRPTVRPIGAPGKVVSAARRDSGFELRAGRLGSRLKSEAENTALNFLARAKEALESFRRSDRFFKYKAGIAAAWFLISVGTLLWAPRSSTGDNRLGATLVVTTVLDHPVYMVKNDSSRTWREVIVVVNRTYRAAVPEVEAGQNLTLGPKQLLGENGSVAPISLELQDFEIRTAQGSARLMEAGRLH